MSIFSKLINSHHETVEVEKDISSNWSRGGSYVPRDNAKHTHNLKEAERPLQERIDEIIHKYIP